MHSKTQSGTTGTCNNIVVLSRGIQKLELMSKDRDDEQFDKLITGCASQLSFTRELKLAK
jgi:hypothetical protein